ncbi:MAG: RNA polymerase sigma factor [Bacteroidota bacterium]
MINEKELIKGCSKHNRKAQQLLYDTYCKKMFAVCIRYCRKAEDAEDILQEAFVKVFNNISSFRKESSLYFWIKKIVINTALNYQRSKLYLYPMVDVNELHYLAEKDMIMTNIQHKDLIKMLQNLPDGCRIIFNLYAIEGFQHKEIAEMLEISIGTSKSQYSRAKFLLKEKIISSEKMLYEKFQQKL